MAVQVSSALTMTNVISIKSKKANMPSHVIVVFHEKLTGSSTWMMDDD